MSAGTCASPDLPPSWAARASTVRRSAGSEAPAVSSTASTRRCRDPSRGSSIARAESSPPPLEDLRFGLSGLLPRARPGPAAPPARPPAPADHDPTAAPAAPAGGEALGDAVQARAPGHVLAEAFLHLLGDGDALGPRGLAEASDAAGGRSLLLLRRRARRQPHVRQRPQDHDLVVLDRDLHPREPAVREPSGKPAFDRSELPLVDSYIITQLREGPRGTSALQQRPCCRSHSTDRLSRLGAFSSTRRRRSSVVRPG